MKPLGERERLWYRRTFEVPRGWQSPNRRVLLHFGGVSSICEVWLNGKEIGRHDGLYDSFRFDITDALTQGEKSLQELVVVVSGPRHLLMFSSGSPREAPCSGIWQTVWLESVRAEHIEDLVLVPDIDAGVLKLTAHCAGDANAIRVEAVAFDRGSEVARATGKPNTEITLPIENARLWSPESPFLYDLRVELYRGNERLDGVGSYFGMRKISIGKDEKGVTRILLNNKFVFQAGVADRGLWPDGIYTAPTERAVRREIELIRQLGFNMARKRIKVEPEYWYYLCDRLGLLVWQDVASRSTQTDEEAKRSEGETLRVVAARRNHPAIVAWVVGEGVSSLERTRLVARVRETDASRLVHNPDGPPDKELGDTFDLASVGHPNVPTNVPRPQEGIATVAGRLRRFAQTISGHTWGQAPLDGEGATRERLTAHYLDLLGFMGALGHQRGLSAFVYGQLTDVETDCTGLVTYDRAVVKIDPEAVADGIRPNPAMPRIQVVIPSGKAEPGAWLYSEKPAGDWSRLDCDTAFWKQGQAGFGSGKVEYATARTAWNSPEIWLRREFTLGVARISNPWILIHHAGDAEIFLNGVLAVKVSGASPDYALYDVERGAKQALRSGRNVLAIHCRKAEGARFIDAGLIELLPQRDCRLPATFSHWPLMDVYMRDTCVCVGPDGTYYLTGTTGDCGREGIRVWKSPDLKNWQDLGLVWKPEEKNLTWQLRNRKKENLRIWAPELHYLEGNFWLTYCLSYPETPQGVSGTGILKSTTGKVEGPYVDIKTDGPLTPGLDGSLFQDDDGAVYFLFGGGGIARMKDDMSGLAEKPREVRCDTGGFVGFEGISMFKANGRYYLSCTDTPLPERDYDCLVAMSDKVYGPFHHRHVAVPHGGHNVFFKDREGRWWSTIFGGGERSPFIEKPGILPVELAPDGTIHPLMELAR
jgi:hypothetical protein